jgi:hypothetical protein
MPKYSVYAEVYGSKYIGDFEAEDEEAAMKLAEKEASNPSLCHQCSGEVTDGLSLGELMAEEILEEEDEIGCDHCTRDGKLSADGVCPSCDAQWFDEEAKQK